MLGLLIGLLSLCLYAYTLHPSISGGDSGELVASAFALTIPHPPGYPLYTLLGYFSMLLSNIISPISSNPAYNMNLLSALFGSLTNSLFYLSSIQLTHSKAISCTISLLWALSPSHWLYSTTAEVFSLHSLLLMVLIYLSILFYKLPSGTGSKATKLVALGAFFAGLSLSNQHISILYLIPLVLFIFAESHSYWLSKTPLLASCALLGLSPYLLLPARTLLRGSWGDQTSLKGFFVHLFRIEYGTFRLINNLSSQSAENSLYKNIWVYFINLWGDECSGPVLCLALFSVLFLATKFTNTPSRHKQLYALIMLSLLFYLLVFLSLSNLSLSSPLYLGIQRRFFVHPNLILYLLSSLGLSQLSSTLPSNISNLIYPLLIAHRLQTVIPNLGINQHNDLLSRVSNASLLTFPNNSILIVNGDLLHNTFNYVHTCLSVRPDIDLLSPQIMSLPWFEGQRQLYPNVVFPGTHYLPNDELAFDMEQFISENLPKRPILVCGGWKKNDHSFQHRFSTVPMGLCDSVVPIVGPMPELEQRLEMAIDALPSSDILGNRTYPQYPDIFWERILLEQCWISTVAHLRVIEAHQLLVKTSPLPDRVLLQAGRIADLLLHLHKLQVPSSQHLEGVLFRNLGIFYGQLSALSGKSRYDYETRMWQSWDIYLSHNTDEGIAKFVSRQLNPYH